MLLKPIYMDIHDSEHFDHLLEQDATHKISQFICAETKKYQQILKNSTSLIFGRFANFVNIPNDGFQATILNLQHTVSLKYKPK